MADALKVFVSSTMKPLRPERERVKTVLEADEHIEAWVYEDDVEARDQTIQATYLERLEQADGYIGIFWKKYGKYTIDEYDHAGQFGIHRMVFIKQLEREDERDEELRDFLDRIQDPEKGEVTPAWFTDPDDLARKVKGAVQQWAKDAIRRMNQNRPPDLLVDRCDRSDHKIEITVLTQSLAKKAESQAGSRPVIFILDGHEEEAHRNFVRVVATKAIPDALDPDSTVVQHKWLNWSDKRDYDSFRRALLYHLSDLFAGKRSFDLTEIAAGLDAHPGPVLVSTVAPTAALAPEPRLYFEHFARFWHEWPARTAERLLLVFLCVPYGETGGRLQRFFRRAPSSDDVRKAATEVAQKTAPGGPLAGVSLHLVAQELGPVPRKDADDWAELDDVVRFVGGPRAVSRVQERIARIYQDREILVQADRIRMQRLSNRLEKILREVRRMEA